MVRSSQLMAVAVSVPYFFQHLGKTEAGRTRGHVCPSTAVSPATGLPWADSEPSPPAPAGLSLGDR